MEENLHTASHFHFFHNPKKKTVNSKQKEESVARWGHQKGLAKLVSKGTNNLDMKPTYKIIDPIRQKFGNRCAKSFQTQYRTCLMKHCTEEDKAGGRKQGKL
jgi:hypothetical protein